ncbi:GntR family transcriptional regulator [Salinisphaera sp. SWV1]|uniref:GntR family transcriptional regulator n=1 Tax=Salinisphaera sp. SWV1 TaxID=3454139 RepID=UPI003F87F6EC
MNANRATSSADLLDQALRTLEEEIVLGLIHPRERLVEDALISRFGLKRHMARQTLVELEAMGLVERRKNVGAMVRSYTVKQVEDLYAVRELLEAEGARLIPMPLDGESLEQLIAIQHRHDEAVETHDLRKVFRINVEFHQTLFALSDNPVLVEAIRDHAKRAHTIRSASFVLTSVLETSRKQHWQMIEALRAGHADELVALCHAHLRPSRDNYIESLKNKLQASPD